MPKVCFNHSNLLDAMNETPPALIRFIARNPDGTAPTNGEIAKRAGIDRHKIHKMSLKTSWANFTVQEIDRFCSACGWDLNNPNSIRRFVRKGKFVHAQRATPRLRKYLTETIAIKFK
jgi:hypothetical protein